MRVFFNHEKIELETHKKYNEISLHINDFTMNSLNYLELIDKELQELIENSPYDREKPLILNIIGPFKRNRRNPDYRDFTLFLQNMAAFANCTEELDDSREKRLGLYSLPHNLVASNISDMALKKLVNNKVKYNIFNVYLVDIKGKKMEAIF